MNQFSQFIYPCSTVTFYPLITNSNVDLCVIDFSTVKIEGKIAAILDAGRFYFKFFKTYHSTEGLKTEVGIIILLYKFPLNYFFTNITTNDRI